MLPVACKFIAIIPVEEAGSRQFLFQLSPGAVKPDLNRMKAQSEDVGNFAVFQLLQLAEDKDGPVVFRKTFDHLPDAAVHFLADNLLLGGGCLFACPELHG